MRVTVHYLAQMRRAAGCSSETVNVPDGASLEALLGELADLHGPSLRGLLLDEANRARRSLLFFVGDEHAEPAQRLQDGDNISILAPMAGG